MDPTFEDESGGPEKVWIASTSFFNSITRTTSAAAAAAGKGAIGEKLGENIFISSSKKIIPKDFGGDLVRKQETESNYGLSVDSFSFDLE